jgi:hypothetical protein
VSICVGLRTYEPIEFDAVDPYVFLEKEQDKSLLDIQKDFVETTGSRISLNVRTVNSKGYLCMWMLRLLMCGGLFFGASFILLLFSLGYTYFLN